VLKNCNDPTRSEVHFHARLCHSKKLLKNIHPMTLASLLFTDEKIFTVTTPKHPHNDQLYSYPSTKKKQVRQQACNKRIPPYGLSRRHRPQFRASVHTTADVTHPSPATRCARPLAPQQQRLVARAYHSYGSRVGLRSDKCIFVPGDLDL